MFFRSFLLILVFIFFFSPFNSSAVVTGPFVRDLSIGSTGQDVLQLQLLLNSDIRTQLAISGPGSPGHETTYFGPLTRQAVISFQTIYEPLVIPTGIVDAATRELLNNGRFIAPLGPPLFLDESLSSTSPPTTQDDLNNSFQAQITVIPGFPYIDSITPNNIQNGDEIVISGRYFSISGPNIVQLTYNQISATSSDGTTIRIKVNSYLNDLFDKQMKGVSDSRRKETIGKIGQIPIFITVDNGKMVSRPYLIYLKLK